MAQKLPFDHVDFHGEPVTRRQRQALVYVENILGFEFYVPQGSWQPVTDYSGTTHSGAGAVDLQFFRMDDDKFFHHVLTVVKKHGCQAAFGRGQPDKMPLHIHCLDLETHGMDEHVGYGAVWQVNQWRKGFNGLSEGGKDRYPFRPDPIKKWNFKE